MASVVPNQYTQIVDAEVSEERPIAEETVRKIAQDVNMLRQLVPVASIRGIQIGFGGLALPNSTIWQVCDGGEITDPDSPLNTDLTQNTPDMQNRFVRGADDGTTAGSEAGGAAVVALNHTHVIGNHTAQFPLTLDNNNVRDGIKHVHSHPLQEDLPEEATLDPKNVQVVFFLKIN